MAKTQSETQSDTALEKIQQGMLETKGNAQSLFAQGFSIEFTASLKQGDAIQGIYLGPGGPIPTEDPNTGEMRELQTWRIKKDNAVCRLIGSAQLNSKFPGVKVGSEVRIEHNGQVAGKGARRVNDYNFYIKEPPAGSTPASA